MNCQRYQESFAEAHDGLLAADADAALHAHLAACPACRNDWNRFCATLDTLERLPDPEPSPRLRAAFEASLAAEIAAETAANTPADSARPSPAAHRPSSGWRAAWESFNKALGHLIPSQPALQAACAVLLLCGGLMIGQRTATTPTAVSNGTDEATRRELATLREQVSSMGQLVAYSLAQQQAQPVGTRLQNVSLTRQNVSQSSATASPAALSVLINALAFDASVNVRLSALEALYEHADQSLSRQAVLAALPRERSPIVQLAMIDFVAATADRDALPVLEALVRDASTHADVAKAANRVLLAERSLAATDAEANANVGAGAAATRPTPAAARKTTL